MLNYLRMTDSFNLHLPGLFHIITFDLRMTSIIMMDFKNVSLYKPKMEYRRFGKTEKKVSVITLGGMRFKHGWDEPRHEIPQDTLDQCQDTVEKALSQGINLIETAYGYGKSETVYGIVLNDVLKVKRDSYFLMTKGASKTAADMRKLVMEQLETLKTDYFDFYAWHGMNTMELYETACAPGGPVEELLKMKEEGLIKHVGFSTHAPLDVILKAIETDLFEFVNLHYYYFFQRNKPAVDLHGRIHYFAQRQGWKTEHATPETGRSHSAFASGAVECPFLLKS